MRRNNSVPSAYEGAQFSRTGGTRNNRSFDDLLKDISGSPASLNGAGMFAKTAQSTDQKKPAGNPVGANVVEPTKTRRHKK